MFEAYIPKGTKIKIVRQVDEKTGEWSDKEEYFTLPFDWHAHMSGRTHKREMVNLNKLFCGGEGFIEDSKGRPVRYIEGVLQYDLAEKGEDGNWYATDNSKSIENNLMDLSLFIEDIGFTVHKEFIEYREYN